MNKNIITTLKKEIRSIFRDKKTLRTMLVFPVIIPIMIFFYGYIYDGMEDTEVTYTVGIDYKLTEPEKTLLDELNIEYEEYKSISEMEKSYKNEEIEAYVSLKDNNYTIYTDTSTTNGMYLAEYLTTYLDGYSKVLTDNYLVEHGIDLNEAYTNITYDYKELSSTNYLLVLILSVCITYVILSIGMAATNMAISSSAQEKENGTLETILTFPIKRTELILGKFFVSSVVSFISSVIALILLIVSLYFAQNQFDSFAEFNFSINYKTILGSIAVIICASLFISGIAFLLTGKAKTFKEAQSSASMINTIMIVPMFISLAEVKITSIYYLIPVWNYVQLLNDLFVNEIVLTNILFAILSTIISIVVVIYLVVKSYNEEKILF